MNFLKVKIHISETYRSVYSVEVFRKQNELERKIARDHSEDSIKWLLFGINQQYKSDE